MRQPGWRVKRESRGIIASSRCWGSVRREPQGNRYLFNLQILVVADAGGHGGEGGAWSQSKRHSRNDVLDHQAVVREDTVNDQPKDFCRLERRIDESVANAGAERLKPFQQPDFLLPLRALAADLVEPLAQMPAMVLDLPTTFLQLVQLDRAGLIGIDQPPDLAVQRLELALQTRVPSRSVGAVDGGIAPALLKARPQ